MSSWSPDGSAPKWLDIGSGGGPGANRDHAWPPSPSGPIGAVPPDGLSILRSPRPLTVLVLPYVQATPFSAQREQAGARLSQRLLARTQPLQFFCFDFVRPSAAVGSSIDAADVGGNGRRCGGQRKRCLVGLADDVPRPAGCSSPPWRSSPQLRNSATPLRGSERG